MKTKYNGVQNPSGFYAWGLLNFAVGIAEFAFGRGPGDAILAGIAFLIATVSFGFGAIITALSYFELGKEAEAKEIKTTPSVDAKEEPNKNIVKRLWTMQR